MHLLFISSLLPDDNPSTGFEIANRAIVESYRSRGIRLSLAGFQRPDAPARAGEISLGHLQIENAGASGARKAAWMASALAGRLPVSATKLKVLDERSLVRRLAAAGPVDGFILNSVQMPTAYPLLTRLKPSIFIAHNVEHLTARQNAENVHGALQRFLYGREARLLEREEARICREAVLVHTLTDGDRDGLGLAEARNCLPLALTIGRTPSINTGERSHDVGLIGNWSWAPNRIGLDWFVSEVMPHVPPDISVAVAGRFDGAPPKAMPNLSYVGRVPDAQAFVVSSRVIALATKGGTGVQLKTIETFEEGMPAVATRAALRGVDSLPENVRVADDPRAFAEALVRLVREERAGCLLRADGSAFARSQKRSLDTAVASGLAIFEAALSDAGRRRAAGATPLLPAATAASHPARG